MLLFSFSVVAANVELPTGAVIETGLATLTQTGNSLNINQHSQNLSSNWNSFNIGADATVNFIQPNASAVAINHILDSNASQIMGQLNANGQVFLLNPNGMVFSKTAQVNVGGLVASTLQLSEADLAAGTFIFSGDIHSTAMLINQGNINSSSGGTVVLIAPNINNAGNIYTPEGITHLTAASQVTLALQDGSLTQYQVGQGVLQGLVENGGAIIADNGAVYLTAKAKDDLSKAIINHSGVIEANRLTENAQGEIILLAEGASSIVNVSGILTAEGKNNQDGGWIETSAAQVNITDQAEVSTLSDYAQTGTWLIDPYNVNIESTTQSNNSNINSTFTPTQNDSVIYGYTLDKALANNNITVSTSAAGTQAGDINVNVAIYWSAATTLTLRADNNIHINEDITATNAKGKLNLQYGQTATNTEANYDLNNGAKVNLQAGQNFTTLKGPDSSNTKTFTVITSLGSPGSTTGSDLQGMNGNLSKNYALGADIDATETVSWNGGAGFRPASNFYGSFDGLGHSISNLTIHSSDGYAGLFGYAHSATIQNLSLLGGSIQGVTYVGSLVGVIGSVNINNIVIQDISVSAVSDGISTMSTGGLVGSMQGGAINHVVVENVNVASVAQGFASIGGLVGFISSVSIINDASVNANVTATNVIDQTGAGGLVGSNSGDISNSRATGDVTVNVVPTDNSFIINAGGLVGISYGSINSSYATGTVLVNSVSTADAVDPHVNVYVGGLLGYAYGGTINNAYATGSVTAAGSYVEAGGLLGQCNSCTVNNTYATSLVVATGSAVFTKGLIGSLGGTVSNSFWDSEQTGQSTSYGGGISKTTVEMQSLSTYLDAGWDIDDQGGTGTIWRIYDGEATPSLRSFLTLVDLHYTDTVITYNGQTQSIYLQLPSDLDDTTLFSLPAIEATNVGTYRTGYFSNQQVYDLINNTANLTIIPAALTITALDQSKTYGDSLNFNGTEFSSAGLVNGETIASIGLSSLGAVATAAVNGSVPYVIEASDVIGGATFDAGNYSINYINGALTVQPASLIITALDQSKTYGDSFSFTGSEFSSVGLVNSETITSVTLSSTGAVATAAVNGGVAYAIQASNVVGGTTFNASNYTISYVNGNLTVKPAILTITASNLSKTYGSMLSFTGSEFSAVGLVNSESITRVTLSSTGAVATAAVNGGVAYAIQASNVVGGTTFNASNYTISYVNGNLTVKPAILTITASNLSKTYGSTLSFTGSEFSAVGLVNSETITRVTLNSTGAVATAAVNGGVAYAIQASNVVGSATFNASNYAISYINGGLTITPAVLTITALDQSKTYGDSLNFTGTEFSSVGLVNGETIASIGLNSLGAVATAAVNGSVPYTIDASNAVWGTVDPNNYLVSYINGDLTVQPASLIITALDQSKTYGDSINFSGTEFSSTGLVNGESISSVSLNSLGTLATAAVNNSEPYVIEISDAIGTTFNPFNYQISYINGALTVQPVSLIVTALEQTKTYGDSFNFNGTEFSSVGLVNDESITSVNLNSLGTVATAAVNNSKPYVIEISDAIGTTFNPFNYQIHYINGSLTVQPASLIITALDQSKTYGDSINFTGSEFSSIGLANDESIASVSLNSLGTLATAAVNNGLPYTIQASNVIGGETFDAGNYLINYINGNLSITPATLTITALDQSKTYGESINFSGSEFSSVGLVNDESITSVNLNSLGTVATAAVNNSEPYVIEISDVVGGETFDVGNYSINYINGSLMIAPAALTITALDQNKTYGDSLNFSGTEFSSVGLVNDESIADSSISLNSLGAIATAAVNGGVPYTIEVTDIVAAGAFDPLNYQINYINGALTVQPASLIITALDLTKTYGDSINFNGTEFSSAGLVNDEILTSVSLDSLGTLSTAAVNNGIPYTIQASNVVGGETFDVGNYSINYINGSLMIAPAALTITALDQSKTYGDSLNFSGTEFSSAGLVNDESISSVSLNSLGTVTTAAVNNGLPYSIQASNVVGGETFDAGNYSINYINGNLTITPAALTITALDQSKTYGDSINFSGTEFSSSGLVNDENITSVSLNSLGTLSTAAVNNGLPYTIQVSDVVGGETFDVGNYSINYINGSLMIAPAALTITALDQSKIYGDSINFTGTEFSSVGLVNDESISSVSLNSLGTVTTAAVNNGLPYTIQASNVIGGETFDAGNYLINYINGNLSITPATLTITALDQSKTYGDSINFSGTEFSSTGLVNGESISSVSLNSLGAPATAAVNNGLPYTIQASNAVWGTVDPNNYLVSYINGALTVQPASLIITALDQSKTYGDSFNFSGTEFSSVGLVNDESIASVSLNSLGTVATAAVNNGLSYTIQASNVVGGENFDVGNYSINYINGSLMIAPAALTITALDQIKTYGDSLNFTGTEFSSVGLVNDEIIADSSISLDSLGTLATATVNGGVPYTIEVTDIVAAGAFDPLNYQINYINGALTVQPASLIITALDQSKTYGDSFNFSGTEFSSAGLVNDESIASVSLNSLGAPATASVNEGMSYTIEASDVVSSGTFDANNYLVSYISGSLIINKKQISITANSLDTIYNGQAQTLTGFTAAGLVNGETEVVLNDVFASVTAKDVGTYSYTATGTDKNYALSFIDGVLTIQPASISNITGITANDRLYDGSTTASLNTEDVVFNGIYSGDELSVATAVGQFADASVGNDKTVYISDLSLGGTDAQNYLLENTTAVTLANIEASATDAVQSTVPGTYKEASQLAHPKSDESDKDELDSIDVEVSQDVVNTSGIQVHEGGG